MPLPPPRRWFRFRLATWFVLVAILAGAMMTSDFRYDAQQVTGAGMVPGDEWQIELVVWSEASSTTHSLLLVVRRAAIWPALALAAFVTWKAVWAIGRWVATRKVEQA